MILPSLLMLAAAADIRSNPELGKAEGRCRANESGPAYLVEVDGLKDRQGALKLELYPANDQDFLGDDDVLVRAGKPFGRVEVPIPASGPVELCIRAPQPGTYALSLLHDRDGNHKFGLSVDGIAFSRNPRLGLSKPKAAAVAVPVGRSPTRLRVTMNYRRGLLSFGPLRQ